MFTVELKINGTLISHLYGHNNGYINVTNDKGEPDACNYDFEYYEVNKGKAGVKNGIVTHKRSEGLTVLVEKILKKINK